ncbi:MAG: Tex-like N-terminal domain-containing protein, partial [Mariprofundaceae bacterium]|nr:Tex-like N-terminal domain-containing protein [Mariprofundaceae bacterium]
MIKQIAQELNVTTAQVSAAIALLDGGATVPFIARYRKEITQNLDDTQLRYLEDRLRYLRELESRRSAILKSIDEQDMLTEDLRQAIQAASTMTRLEDLYLPYKPRRRTKAHIAKEAGLEPLAQQILSNHQLIPETVALDFINPEQNILDVQAALDGAQHIIMEQLAEQADALATLRDYLQEHAVVAATLVKGKEQEAQKFTDYFDYTEAWKRIPSHRALALFRGQKEGLLRVKLVPSMDEEQAHAYCEQTLAQSLNIQPQGEAADDWLQQCVRLAWRSKVLMHLEVDLLMA